MSVLRTATETIESPELRRLNRRAYIVKRLRAVAEEMLDVGCDMEYFGDFGDVVQHGREMIEAGNIAKQWANHIDTEDAHPPSRLCGCGYCAPSFED